MFRGVAIQITQFVDFSIGAGCSVIRVYLLTGDEASEEQDPLNKELESDGIGGNDTYHKLFWATDPWAIICVCRFENGSQMAE
jgi:hypothetical protein